MAIKVGFVTCVQLGLDCMEEIRRCGGRLDLAITLRDGIARRKSGRVYIDGFCAEQATPLLKVRHIDDGEAAAAVRAHAIDWLFIVGWSQIAGAAVLTAPKRGALGMHPTLLPEGRGRAAIPWAILKGLPRTGVTLFKLDGGVDTGPIVAQQVVPMAVDQTATDLYRKVGDAHRALIAGTWSALQADRLELRPQDGSLATIWPGRTPADGEILPSMSVDEVDRLVRATTRPYPGAFHRTAAGAYTVWAGCKDKVNATDVAIPLRDGTFWASEHKFRDDSSG